MAFKKYLRLFDRKRKSEPARKAPKYSDEELLARADEFNRNAENYWRDLAKGKSGLRHVMNKPFAGIPTVANNVYRLGLMLAELKLGLGMTVLDFGAGSCWLSSCLNLLGCRTIASDVSPAALELGRQLFKSDSRHRPELEPRFLVYDGHRLDLPSESIDRIACFDAFHHVPNQDEVLAEMFRVLRWGGRAVLIEPGIGFAQASTSDFEEERFGVLENELDPLDLEVRALRAGFTAMSLKPYPPPASLNFTPQEYVRFVSGDASVLPISTYQRDLRDYLTCTLAKGAHVFDSRNPNVLAAQWRLLEPNGNLRGVQESTLALLLEIRNTGDTHWLNRLDPLGGYVAMGVSLHDHERRLVANDYLRASLPHDVHPGEKVLMFVQIPLPQAVGRYVLHFDLVSEDVAWFSQFGSATMDLPVEVLSASEAGEPAGHGDLPDRKDWPAEAPTMTSTRRSALEFLGQSTDLRTHAGGYMHFPLRVTNHGACTWPISLQVVRGAIRLGAQLLDPALQVLDVDFARFDLNTELPVNASTVLDLKLRAPKTAGTYMVRFDLLQEEVCWFAERGGSPLDLQIVVDDEQTDSSRPGVLLHQLELLEPRSPLRLPVGQTLPLLARAKNLGNTIWLKGAAGAIGHVLLGGHLQRISGPRHGDFFRAPLPRDVAPGETVEIACELTLPESPGMYQLEIDLVDEGLAWFAWEDSKVTVIEIEIY